MFCLKGPLTIIVPQELDYELAGQRVLVGVVSFGSASSCSSNMRKFWFFKVSQFFIYFFQLTDMQESPALCPGFLRHSKELETSNASRGNSCLTRTICKLKKNKR